MHAILEEEGTRGNKIFAERMQPISLFYIRLPHPLQAMLEGKHGETVSPSRDFLFFPLTHSNS
jgi:hypothetical protein